MADVLNDSIHFVCDKIENEKLVKEGVERQNGTTYDGDVVTGRMCIWRTSNRPNPKGPWKVDIGWPNKIEFSMDSAGVDEGSAAFLHGLVRALRPRVVLETGTHKGRSTHAIASALVDNAKEVRYVDQGRIYTVDMDDYGVLPLALTPQELLITTQIIGKCPEILDTNPLHSLKNIDFAFLDGAHDAETVIKELEFVDERRTENCIVLVDNAADTGWPEIREYFNTYMLYPHIPLLTMCGMEIINMRGEKRRHGKEKAS